MAPNNEDLAVEITFSEEVTKVRLRELLTGEVILPIMEME